MEYELRRFDPTTIPNNAVCLFIGTRGTGKSTALKDILYHKRSIPSGVVFSQTEVANKFFSDCIPSTFIFPGYDQQVLDRLLRRQKTAKKKGEGKPCFIVADDCMYDNRTIKKDPNIRLLFMNGRHWDILAFVTMQYALDIDPGLRMNADYVFVFNDIDHNNRKRLYENFFGIFPSREVFDKVMDACTEDYHCLVLDKRKASNKVEDRVFWYKAKERSNFRVGSSAFWKYHMINYNPEASDEDEDVPRPARKGVSVVVKKTM